MHKDASPPQSKNTFHSVPRSVTDATHASIDATITRPLAPIPHLYQSSSARNTQTTETSQFVLPPVRQLIKAVDIRYHSEHFNYKCCPSMPAVERQAHMIALRGADTFTFTHKSIEARMHANLARWHGLRYTPRLTPAITFHSDIQGTRFPGVSVCDIYNGMDTLISPNTPAFLVSRPTTAKIGIRLPAGPNHKYIYFDISLPGGCTCGNTKRTSHEGSWTSHAIAWKKFNRVALNSDEAVECAIEQLRLGALDPEIRVKRDGSQETVLMARFFVVKEPRPSVNLPVQPFFIPRAIEEQVAQFNADPI